ncbi:MAG: ATP synthase F1 subunit epsilon [Flavobacteriales bacterium]|jgi:F-type H+-transporting ATPase subunit epsilon|nr:ATP synthase F1 subunit epsilon [Flavobacteriales bacterium]|tara:strand:- start:3874 stop:4110 length:237 start_codon:yes stop_codon:yes gene_type:complete
MLLDILTPEKKLFEGDVKSVKFPGTNGEFEILNNHAPIISTLTKGEIRVLNSNDEQEVFNINGGVIEMQNNKIIVLAD